MQQGLSEMGHANGGVNSGCGVSYQLLRWLVDAVQWYPGHPGQLTNRGWKATHTATLRRYPGIPIVFGICPSYEPVNTSNNPISLFPGLSAAIVRQPFESCMARGQIPPPCRDDWTSRMREEKSWNGRLQLNKAQSPNHSSESKVKVVSVYTSYVIIIYFLMHECEFRLKEEKGKKNKKTRPTSPGASSETSREKYQPWVERERSGLFYLFFSLLFFFSSLFFCIYLLFSIPSLLLFSSLLPSLPNLRKQKSRSPLFTAILVAADN